MSKTMPSVPLLKAIESLSRNRTHRDVAKELGVTKVTVSVQIKRFEESTGVKLVERSRGQGGQSVLTPDGRALAAILSEHLPPIVKALEKLDVLSKKTIFDPIGDRSH